MLVRRRMKDDLCVIIFSYRSIFLPEKRFRLRSTTACNYLVGGKLRIRSDCIIQSRIDDETIRNGLLSLSGFAAPTIKAFRVVERSRNQVSISNISPAPHER